MKTRFAPFLSVACLAGCSAETVVEPNGQTTQAARAIPSTSGGISTLTPPNGWGPSVAPPDAPPNVADEPSGGGAHRSENNGVPVNDPSARTEPPGDPMEIADAAMEPRDASEEWPFPSLGVKAIKTVFLIVLANKDWSSIRFSINAPYINSLLWTWSSAFCEGYKNSFFTNVHPSVPNYQLLEAGQTATSLAAANADPGVFNCARGVDHLTKQMDRAGLDWRSYQEGVKGRDEIEKCPLRQHENYVARHNPFLYFDDVSGSNCSDRYATNCLRHISPYLRLDTDLKNNSVARYNFISPDQCNNMHGGISCIQSRDQQIKAGDDWLRREVPRIMASDAYKDHGAIIITWDEGEWIPLFAENNPIGMIVLSPDAANGPHDCTGLSHLSTLRTLQEIFFLFPKFLNGAAGVRDLAILFK